MKKNIALLIVLLCTHMPQTNAMRAVSRTSNTALMKTVMPNLQKTVKFSTNPKLPAPVIKAPVSNPSGTCPVPSLKSSPLSSPLGQQYRYQHQNVPSSSFFEKYKNNNRPPRSSLGVIGSIMTALGYAHHEQNKKEEQKNVDAKAAQWVDALCAKEDIVSIWDMQNNLLGDPKTLMAIFISPSHMTRLLNASNKAIVRAFFREALEKNNNDEPLIHAWTNTVASLQELVMSNTEAIKLLTDCFELFNKERDVTHTEGPLTQWAPLLNTITTQALPLVNFTAVGQDETLYNYLFKLCKSNDASATLIIEQLIASKAYTHIPPAVHWRDEEFHTARIMNFFIAAFEKEAVARAIAHRPDLITTLIKNEGFGYLTLWELWKTAPQQLHDIQTLVNQSNDEMQKDLLIAAYYNTHPTELTQEYYASLSPTTKHLIHHFRDALPLLPGYTTVPEKKLLFARYLKEANRLEENGYSTFIHGQKFDYYLPETWVTRLWELKHKSTTQQFLFPHIKPLSAEREEQKQVRETIVLKGRPMFESENFETSLTRSHMLFMNRYFFGNARDPGSCTAKYVATNYNVNSAGLTGSLKTAFDTQGYGHIYEQFKGELEALHEESKKLTNFGNLLLIGVPQNNLDNMVLTANPYGTKKHSGREYRDRYSKEWAGGASTPFAHNTQDNLRSLEQKPFSQDMDTVEFCLAMTQDTQGALNPESGIKIVPINGIDEKTWQAFKQKEETLWQKIKKAIEKEKR